MSAELSYSLSYLSMVSVKLMGVNFVFFHDAELSLLGENASRIRIDDAKKTPF